MASAQLILIGKMLTMKHETEVVDEVMVELSRKKTPLELTLLASRMFDQARDRLKSFLRHKHPELSDARLREELVRRIHGLDLSGKMG